MSVDYLIVFIVNSLIIYILCKKLKAKRYICFVAGSVTVLLDVFILNLL